jgi:hypothetical protein
MVNQHSGYDLQPEGQEYFTIIQYNKDDEYRYFFFFETNLSNIISTATKSPHCDGSCDNSYYVRTGRVATAVMYCEVWFR